MMSTTNAEWWIMGWPVAKATVGMARGLEAAGWDGLLLPDTQCLAGDSFIELALCGAATRRLKLGTGVTNPVTRDSSVLASAVATLQEETDGRVSLGIGRGDSSLAYIGREPARLGVFRSFLLELQAYLRGEPVDRDGFASSVHCVQESSQPKVPVDIAGTGPKIVDMAARHADGITLAVGAYPDRIARKIADVEAALAKHGRSRQDFSISVYLNCVANEDRAAARDLARGTVGVLARFSGMGPAAGADLSEADQATVAKLFAEYDMSQHASCHAPHAKKLSDDFLDRFAVVGPPEEVFKRLDSIAQQEIDRIVLIPGSAGAEAGLAEENVARLSAKVLPKLRIG
jgi:5,10-methylenetetrahydromethanopterin reductase